MAVPPLCVTVDDVVRVVADTAAAVVPPIAGGLLRSSVPPRVKLPDEVTVPDSEMPLTVPVPPTLVTVPSY